MNETELAQKLGISRKCLWERRQRFGIPPKAKSPEYFALVRICNTVVQLRNTLRS